MKLKNMMICLFFVAYNISEVRDRVIVVAPTEVGVLHTCNCMHDQLLKAVKDGTAYQVERIVHSGVNPLSKDRSGKTTLHIASRRNNGVLNVLLRYGAHPNVGDDDGKSPLWEAVESGLYNNVQVLINYGANISVRAYGKTLLHLALEKRLYEIARLLLDRGVVIDAFDDDGDTPLHKAVGLYYDAYRWTTLLVERGASLASRDAYGRTPLQRAVSNHTYAYDVIDFLIRCGSSLSVVDKNGATLLHSAASCNNVHLTHLFLRSGLDTRRADKRGKTPLHYAAQNNALDVVKILLQIAWDGINDSTYKGYTPLTLASYYGYVNMVELLISAGAYINVIDNDGNTPLLYAFNEYNHNQKNAQLLITKGANVQMQYSNGDTLLHRAVKRKWYDVIRLLIYRGISVNVCNNKGETPLFGAVHAKDMVSATHLINYGADVHCVDSRRNTVLHYAAHNKHIELLHLLIKAGAFVNAQNIVGRTPLHEAFIAKDITGVKILVGYGAYINLPDDQGNTILSQVQSLLNNWSWFSSIKSFFGFEMSYKKLKEFESFLLKNGACI